MKVKARAFELEDRLAPPLDWWPQATRIYKKESEVAGVELAASLAVVAPGYPGPLGTLPGSFSGQQRHRRSGLEVLVEGDHLVERKVGADVAVQDEEGRGVSGSNLVPEVVNSSGSSERGVLLQVPADR